LTKVGHDAFDNNEGEPGVEVIFSPRHMHDRDLELRHTTIFARALDRMTTYREGLGVRPVPKRSQAGRVDVDGSGSLLALHAIPESLAGGTEITAAEPRAGNPDSDLLPRPEAG
jgi:hypothetical protein